MPLAASQNRVRTTGDQSGTALLFCVLECLVLYIEYMSVSIFIAAIANGDGTECEDTADCAARIGQGLTAYGCGVAYFAMCAQPSPPPTGAVFASQQLV